VPLSRYELIKVERLLGVIFPSRLERACNNLTGFAYSRGETGLWGFVGDQSDRLMCFSNNIRARWRVRFKYRER
jgi:hypothetical protein